MKRKTTRSYELPTFTHSEDWLVYHKLLADRLGQLQKINGNHLSTGPVRGLSLEKPTPAYYLKLLYEWMDSYGVNPHWLFDIDNRHQTVMQSGKELCCEEKKGFLIICERFLKALTEIRLMEILLVMSLLNG